MNREEAMKY